MLILVTYDVSTLTKAGARRLRRIARACLDYGQRVQNSVFECRVDERQWVLLRDRLLTEMKADEDSLRFYFLDRDTRIEHHGIGQPIDFEAPIIF